MRSVSTELRLLASKYEALTKELPQEHYCYLIQQEAIRAEYDQLMHDALAEALVAGEAYEERTGKILPWTFKARQAMYLREKEKRNKQLYQAGKL